MSNNWVLIIGGTQGIGGVSVEFLIGENSQYLTGQTIVLDDGLTA